MKKKRKIKEEFKIKFHQADMFKITSICLTILFLGLMSASVTHAETESYKLVKQWGSEGSGNGQFLGLWGIAVDTSGNVYVGDANNHRIQKFDSNGKFITKWGSYGKGNGQFDYLEFIAVDSSGNVYVVDSYNNRVQKFDSNGKFITKWGSYGTGNGQFNEPQGIAVDSSGNVYVADKWNYRIQKFDSNGKFITKWGSYGSGNGQFANPLGIAVDSSDNVYVIDHAFFDFNINRIEKFDSNGKFITKWGSSDQFIYPYGIAIDSIGNVYVTGDEEIYEFDSNGKFITKWSVPYLVPEQSGGLSGVAVDSSRNVYVDYFLDSSVLKYAPTTPTTPVAAFSATPTSGKVPLTVKFTDKSTGSPTSWKWSFGDGSTSTAQNPTHKYSKTGKYTVSLTVKNAKGSSTITKSNYINVVTVPVAAFSASPTSGKVPLTVKFTDKSTGSPTSWSWNFGDKTISTAQNPTHKYTKTGKYTVSLTVKNTAGSNTKTMSNYVTVKSK
jgi:PKD repeat protein